MQIVKTVRELQQLSEAERAAGHRIALVPTMGALHPGHLSLVDQARRSAERVWVSIFVNPLQVDRPDDLAAYPRSLEADLEACREAGVDAVFVPADGEMFAADADAWVDVGALTQPLCGATRPGHFRGVTTVVTKLFHAARPHVAIFGEKDFQQLAVIRRMVRDLCFDVEIEGAPVERESDGLAWSSRNNRLDPEARRQAVVLSRALEAAEKAVAEGERDCNTLLRLVRAEVGRASLSQIDYAELRDPDSLAIAPPRIEAPTLLALAVSFTVKGEDGKGRVRLIDNRVLRPQPHQQDPR